MTEFRDRTPQRQFVNDVISSPATLSDKIWALAGAGYDRTEISNLLKIQYQHVRNVLIDPGIMGALRRQADAERQPITVDADPAACDTTSSHVLLRAGFQYIGEWVQEADSSIALYGGAPAKPGVYVFVVDGAVAYVGLTNTDFATRFEQYRRGHVLQPTNARIKRLISKALADGHRVKVLVATPDALEWNGLPMNTAAGLETALIQKMRPVWNIPGTG